MARFTLREGERIVSQHSVALVDGQTTLPAYISLTTERLVVTAGKRVGKGWMFLFGLPMFLALRGLSSDQAPRIYYEMRRDKFASVEVVHGDMLVFRDSGEGYLHVSFSITHDLTTPLESLTAWEQRLHAWAIMRPS